MTTYQVQNQSDSINKIKGGYGGSDSSRPSFNRPAYVKYNSFEKARDLGTVDNLEITLEGDIGTETGASSKFYKVNIAGDADLRIVLNTLSQYTGKYISVGILDKDRQQLPLNASGYAYKNQASNTALDEYLEPLKKGLYYFTVSSSRWQSTQFSVTFSVFRYKTLKAKCGGELIPYGRVGLSKLVSTAELTDQSYGTIIDPTILKTLSGDAGGVIDPSMTISIFRGTITGHMSPYGRIRAHWRIAGNVNGTNVNTATLTATSPYGGGY